MESAVWGCGEGVESAAGDAVRVWRVLSGDAVRVWRVLSWDAVKVWRVLS